MHSCELCSEEVDVEDYCVSVHIEDDSIKLNLDYHSDCFAMATNDVFNEPASINHLGMSCYYCNEPYERNTSNTEICYWQPVAIVKYSVNICDNCRETKFPDFHSFVKRKILDLDFI